MAHDIFIKINGIDGESQDLTHRDEIEVLGWNWSASQQSRTRSCSGSVAKVSASALSFTHMIDTASPNLASYCFQGRHVPNVVLTMRKAGDIPLEYLKITMFDVIVTRVELAAGAGLALEHVALSFVQMKKEYAVQSPIGVSQGAVTALIDVKRNSVS